MKREKIAILAGTYTEFIQFMSQPETGDTSEYYYIDRPEKVVGIRFFDYKIIGSFWNKKDADKLLDNVKAHLIADNKNIGYPLECPSCGRKFVYNGNNAECDDCRLQL